MIQKSVSKLIITLKAKLTCAYSVGGTVYKHPPCCIWSVATRNEDLRLLTFSLHPGNTANEWWCPCLFHIRTGISAISLQLVNPVITNSPKTSFLLQETKVRKAHHIRERKKNVKFPMSYTHAYPERIRIRDCGWGSHPIKVLFSSKGVSSTFTMSQKRRQKEEWTETY